jgi:penicillin-binding protein 2A
MHHEVIQMGIHMIRVLVAGTLLAGLLALLVVGSLLLPSFDSSKLNMAYKTTTILDDNDQPVATYQAMPGDPVTLDEVPVTVQKALIDVEDVRFYEHNGLDPRGIGRALYHDIVTRSASEGGSTLTQQLARTVYLTQDRTATRKLQEIYLAAQIERHFSKDEILEMYLNRVYFGNGAFGIKAAAETYFGKGQNLQSLTLAESALLAGLVNGPSLFNPWVQENVPLALDRRRVVLEAMYKNGDITAAQLEQAAREPIRLTHGTNLKGMSDTPKYPHYLDTIVQEAHVKWGIPADEVLRSGMTVHTYLDPEQQRRQDAALDTPLAIRELTDADGRVITGVKPAPLFRTVLAPR